MGNKNVAYFRVCKFEELQHYRDRSPPWIKLYNSLLDDYEFATLDDASKFHLVAIWLLASRNSNCIPMDAKWVQRRIDAHKQVDLQQFIDAGFIEKIPEESDTTQPDSEVLAGCYQDAIPEGEGEESREETDGGDSARDVFDYWREKMGKDGKTKLTSDRRQKIKSRMANDGFTVDDLKQAVTGCANSPFHMGENERRQKYNDIELICRTGSQVEKFMELAGQDQSRDEGGSRAAHRQPLGSKYV